MTNELAAALAAQTTGRVWTHESTDSTGYDHERSGFNLSLDHRPKLVLAAEAPADITAGIRFATDHGLPVDIQATGHGAHRAMTGGLLINTRRLNGVVVDPTCQTARVSAGATAADVINATARHGLAATVGAAPGVGFISYSLGGGLGLLGRKHGWSADHIRSLDVVTADGRELVVTRNDHPDLFWGLRGGGGSLAAVTEIEIDLLPVAHFYGGGLFLPGEHAAAALARFQECTADAPRELSLSVAFVAFPDLALLPPPIRGRFCCHVRVTYLGDGDGDGDGRSEAEAEKLIARLRVIPALLDTTRSRTLTEIGAVHADPVDPRPVHSDSVALNTGDVIDDLAPLLDPAAAFMLEVRHLGGALADEPDVLNAVGHREARYNLFTSAYPGIDPKVAGPAQTRIYDRVAPHSAGGPLRTFLPSQYPNATTCYEPRIATRLHALKGIWDPSNRFAYAPAVTLPEDAPIAHS